MADLNAVVGGHFTVLSGRWFQSMGHMGRKISGLGRASTKECQGPCCGGYGGQDGDVDCRGLKKSRDCGRSCITVKVAKSQRLARSGG